jgi:hypothetical protein
MVSAGHPVPGLTQEEISRQCRSRCGAIISAVNYRLYTPSRRPLPMPHISRRIGRLRPAYVRRDIRMPWPADRVVPTALRRPRIWSKIAL